MYIEHVPNRHSPPAVLLRESYRDGNTVKKRTLANLSSLPAEVIERPPRLGPIFFHLSVWKIEVS